MFEDKKWSDALKKAAEQLFLRITHSDDVAKLVEMAIEEGRQEVLDDPRKFDLYSEDDANDRAREREPQRDESRD